MGAQHDQILVMLRAAGDKGLHSQDFMESFLPAFSQRIGELRLRGYTIRSARERFPRPGSVAVGKRYWLESEPPSATDAIPLFPRPVQRYGDVA